MIIEYIPKINGQVVFEIPEYFRNRHFWLNINGNLYYVDRELDRIGDTVKFKDDIHRVNSTVIMYFTNE